MFPTLQESEFDRVGNSIMGRMDQMGKRMDDLERSKFLQIELFPVGCCRDDGSLRLVLLNHWLLWFSSVLACTRVDISGLMDDAELEVPSQSDISAEGNKSDNKDSAVL